MGRTTIPKNQVLRELIDNPAVIARELYNRSFYRFFLDFWPEISNDPFVDNWHIQLICEELQMIAENVGDNVDKEHDLLINIAPGTTKTKICSVAFPVWCWTRWPWMQLITLSYSASLALESAELSRDMIRSERFRAIYPELEIKDDKDTKSNYRIVSKKQVFPNQPPQIVHGGNRFSTSVGGSLTGYHGHIIIVDDPINPQQAVSATELAGTNRWLDLTLPTRKTNKKVSTIVMIMQRLAKNDPTGHWLSKNKENLRHICLPAEIENFASTVKPAYLKEFYIDNLFDPLRMPWSVLNEMKTDLGQYGYSGQIGQNPKQAGAGMFKTDMFSIVNFCDPSDIIEVCRFWDKAGTKEKADLRKANNPAWTVGCKMAKLISGKYIILDIKRGRWSSEEREKIILTTAQADGVKCSQHVEQEPGSGGKESAENTIRNLDGYVCKAHIPQGDKIYRADPYSVQVNNGAVLLLYAPWNTEFMDEHKDFPFSTFKDQVDASGGAYGVLVGKKQAKVGD